MTGFFLEMSTNDENTINTHSTCDGILEVLGIVSSFHIAQLQVGLNKPIRFGQAKVVRVRVLPFNLFFINLYFLTDCNKGKLSCSSRR